MSVNSVFALSELVGPQIYFIHGLTSSASQPLNNWRNYLARGSKAPQKCVMPLSKACRKEKKKQRVRGGLLIRGCAAAQYNPVMLHLHTKLKHRGWWCHKWQALTGRISIAHNSRSPCMSDKFMILSEMSLSYFPLHENGCFLESLDFTMQFGWCPSYKECDWRNINLQTKRLAQLLRTISGLGGGNVSLDFSLLLHELFHFLPILI